MTDIQDEKGRKYEPVSKKLKKSLGEKKGGGSRKSRKRNTLKISVKKKGEK